MESTKHWSKAHAKAKDAPGSKNLPKSAIGSLRSDPPPFLPGVPIGDRRAPSDPPPIIPDPLDALSGEQIRDLLELLSTSTKGVSRRPHRQRILPRKARESIIA